MIEGRKIWICDFCKHEICLLTTEIKTSISYDAEYEHFDSLEAAKVLHLTHLTGKYNFKKDYDFCNLECLHSWVVQEKTEKAFGKPNENDQETDIPF